jgi:pimeloyl-ACP methyl ester carboxylesterase
MHRTLHSLARIVIALSPLLPVASLASTATLETAREVQCSSTDVDCGAYDAIVFVHGIYGSRETFSSGKSGWSWPKDFPNQLAGRKLDVFSLNYQSSLLSWAKGSSADFDSLAEDAFTALRPLRSRKYRSIGFIAHSLGGNVVATYLVKAKLKRGTSGRAQHLFLVTLATPFSGSRVADLGASIKSSIGMRDDLLESLKKDNLYLRMLKGFTVDYREREHLYECRPFSLYAAFEKKAMGPFLIVEPESAAQAVNAILKSSAEGFDLDHSGISKPDGPGHRVAGWVVGRVQEALELANAWDVAPESQTAESRYCRRAKYLPE